MTPSLDDLYEGRKATQAEILAERQARVDAGEAPRVLSAPARPIVYGQVLAEDKPGLKTTEFWIALLLPLVVGAVVELGWLSEDGAVQVGGVTGGLYVMGRQMVKTAKAWRRP